MLGSDGVDGVLTAEIRPVASSIATTSVNVPPVSMAILSPIGDPASYPHRGYRIHIMHMADDLNKPRRAAIVLGYLFT
jgi:hypothetical protein